MTGFSLFIGRLKMNWKFQWRIFRMIADWTVMIYIIIPAAVIFFVIYRSWWLEAPEWADALPLSLFFILGYIWSWMGNVRFFSEDGDRLFLIRKKQLMHSVYRWGFVYSAMFHACLAGLFLLLLLPFLLVHFQLSGQASAGIFLFWLAMKYLLLYLKFHLRRITRKIRRFFAGFLVFCTTAAVSILFYVLWANDELAFLYGFSAAIIVFSVGLYTRLLDKTFLFEHFRAIDREQKLRAVGFIYQFSLQTEKISVIKRTRPWLFPRSGAIFRKRTPVNGFKELFLKLFLRNKLYLSSYMRMLFFTAAAIIIVPPLWAKILIFVVFIFMAAGWFESVWDKTFLKHPVAGKYCKGNDYFIARRQMINRMVLFSAASMLMLGGGGWLLLDLFIPF